MQDIKDIQSVLQSLDTDIGIKSLPNPGFSGPILSTPEFEYQERIYKVICRDLVRRKSYEKLLYNICILGCVYDSRVHRNVGKILKDKLKLCAKCEMKCFDEDIKDKVCYLCIQAK